MSKIQKNFLKFKNVKISRELQVLRSLSGYGHWRGAGRAAAWQRPTLNIFPVRPFNFCQQISLFFNKNYIQQFYKVSQYRKIIGGSFNSFCFVLCVPH